MEKRLPRLPAKAVKIRDTQGRLWNPLSRLSSTVDCRLDLSLLTETEAKKLLLDFAQSGGELWPDSFWTKVETILDLTSTTSENTPPQKPKP